jgi:hypothetical protein
LFPILNTIHIMSLDKGTLPSSMFSERKKEKSEFSIFLLTGNLSVKHESDGSWQCVNKPILHQETKENGTCRKRTHMHRTARGTPSSGTSITGCTCSSCGRAGSGSAAPWCPPTMGLLTGVATGSLALSSSPTPR